MGLLPSWLLHTELSFGEDKSCGTEKSIHSYLHVIQKGKGNLDKVYLSILHHGVGASH